MKRALFTCLAFLCMVSKGYAQDDFTDDYNDFVKDANKEYKDFRDKANSEYADFMEKAWKEYGMKTPLEHPVKKWDDPLTYDKKKAQQELLQKNKKLLEAQKAIDAQKKMDDILGELITASNDITN